MYEVLPGLGENLCSGVVQCEAQLVYQFVQACTFTLCRSLCLLAASRAGATRVRIGTVQQVFAHGHWVIS